MTSWAIAGPLAASVAGRAATTASMKVSTSNGFVTMAVTTAASKLHPVMPRSAVTTTIWGHRSQWRGGKASHDLIAVHAQHAQVEDHQAVFVGRHHREAFLAVAGGGDGVETGAREKSRHEAAEYRSSSATSAALLTMLPTGVSRTVPGEVFGQFAAVRRGLTPVRPPVGAQPAGVAVQYLRSASH